MSTWHGPQPDIRCEWRDRPHGPRCGAAAMQRLSVRPSGSPWVPNPRTWVYVLCDEHAGGPAPASSALEPLIRDPRVAACVVGAITGATPHRWPADMLRAGSTDRSMLEVALDHIEQHALYLPDAWPTDAGVEWPEARGHVHVWLTIERATNAARWISPVWRRCSCGMSRSVPEIMGISAAG